MLHVCCIRAGEAFSPAYVVLLKDMVIRNLEGGFPGRFVCFTDRPEELPDDIVSAPLPADLPGWWSKLALFREGLFPAGDRVLFFDLDTVITGAIDALAAYDGEFGILADFYRPHGLQSPVMAWQAGRHSNIWESFERAGCPMDNPGGDQAWIERCQVVGRERLQVKFPGMFVSYKQTRGIPNDASVVVFHGHPRPHEVTDGWVPKVWKVGGLSHSELTAVCNTAQEAIFANVRSACARDLAWFDADNAEHDRHVAIIGGGPSVRDLLDEIGWRQSQGQQVWALNNAAAVCIDHGIRLDAQVLLDARADNKMFLRSAGEYLISSQCDPSVFDTFDQPLSGVIEKPRVTLWHANTPSMAELLKDEKARVTYLIGGGTTVGMNALVLAVARGYRKIHLYGFDSSYRDGAHHAYSQSLNDSDAVVDVLYADRHYRCATWMVGQANEFAQMARQYEADGVVITVHGSGLLPDIARDLASTMTPAETRAAEILKRAPNATRGAEIGVFAGEMSRALLQAMDGLQLFMVDSWEGEGAAYREKAGDWHAELTAQSQEDFYRQAVKRIAFAGDRATILRKRSGDALAEIADRSLDFVFIDADHSYAGCCADLEGWERKIKPGGWLCGHDYENPDFPDFGVTRAVNEYVASRGYALRLGENLCWFVQLPKQAQRAA